MTVIFEVQSSLSSFITSDECQTSNSNRFLRVSLLKREKDERSRMQEGVTFFSLAHFTWKEQSALDEVTDDITRSFRGPRIGLIVETS